MRNVSDTKALSRISIQPLVCIPLFVGIAAVLFFCIGCGLTAHSLGAINKSLPVSPLPNSKGYSPVQTLVISPDERYLIQGQHITAKEGETYSGDILQVWNIEKKKHSLVSRQRVGANLAATFSPDSKYVIACGNAGVARVQLSDEATQVVPLEEPKYLSADGSLVACMTSDGWQVRSINVPNEIHILPENVDRFLAFSPDKKIVATTVKKENQPGGGATVAIWSLEKKGETDTPTLLREISVPSYFPSAEKTRFSSNGRFLALPSRQGGYVGVWDVANGKMHKELGVHDGSIRTLEFSPDGKILAVGTQEANGKHGRIYLWDVITGTAMQEINEHYARGVTAICFASDNETIFFGNSSGEFKRINIKGGGPLFSFMSQ